MATDKPLFKEVPDEAANNERKIKPNEDEGPVDSISDAIGTLVRPFTRERVSSEQVEEKREEIDREERG